MRGFFPQAPYERNECTVPSDLVTNTDSETLRKLMYDEAYDSKYYADLARRRYSSRAASFLNKLSGEESRHLRRLQAEYYILTGTAVNPCVVDIEIPCFYMDALRERFLSESDGARAYLDAAASTANPRLAAIYTDISADESRHADEMAKLISDYLCSDE